MDEASIPFDRLATADLIVGAIYRGGTAGSIGDEPLAKLMGCGNMGGFRIVGGPSGGGYRLAVLFTTFHDPDWPDQFDEQNGLFHYYGDNKEPGRALHETPRGGNELLRLAFDAIHVEPHRRHEVPPFFLFSSTGKGRDVRFLGLAAPGARGTDEMRDLVATWRTRGAVRFQNYRATFTVLNVPRIARCWIDDLKSERSDSPEAPGVWSKWVETGTYEPLLERGR